jgi:hypothetical protein
MPVREARSRKPSQEYLAYSSLAVPIADSRSFGKMRWGTFFVLFFILATIASGAYAVYKRYNVVKKYQEGHRVLDRGEVIYQRLV